MKLQKKEIFKALIIVVIVLALGGCAFGAYVGVRAWGSRIDCTRSYDEVYSMGGYALDAGEDGVIKVLKINDTHFIDGEIESDKRTLDELKVVLDNNPVDLIVMAGDLVEGFNLNIRYDKENAIRKFAELMEEYDTPWTFIPGNNDGEIDGSNRDVIAFLLSYEHFITGNVKEIYGDTQFYVDVTYNSERVHLLAFMDTGMRKPKITGPYDHLRESQVENLKATIEERGVRTSLFIHMQTPAFGEAYENGKDCQNMPKRMSSSYKSIPKNSNFDKALEGEELLTLVSCGHQHGNDVCAYYEGRYYQLSSPSGYTAWMPEDVTPTATLTIINVLEESVEDAYHFEKVWC